MMRSTTPILFHQLPPIVPVSFTGTKTSTGLYEYIFTNRKVPYLPTWFDSTLATRIAKKNICVGGVSWRSRTGQRPVLYELVPEEWDRSLEIDPYMYYYSEIGDQVVLHYNPLLRIVTSMTLYSKRETLSADHTQAMQHEEEQYALGKNEDSLRYMKQAPEYKTMKVLLILTAIICILTVLFLR